MVKGSELREMSDEQLRLTLKEVADDLFHLRIQSQTERLDAPTELKKHRRLIARIKTIQGQRARAAAGKAGKG
jgi:large subunit ribosomal protein L29